ncbi:MAG: alpha/beta hydrolase [Rhodoferax sp.]|nr:alpha/beta hydrolase [Rhodoferax sp.]MCB2005445.1 alpha/beta hydrolase [Rhodoferax sp.]MCB2029879.1 alpha/beta hydrolase [Rhodoferax sp.]MCB2044181.1 alpha/beta hydrolase [Rhodoferax sp.]
MKIAVKHGHPARTSGRRVPKRLYGALFGAAMLLATASAHAARECEHPHYVPAEGACARLSGADLFYYDTGASRRGRGEAVIFVHAASGNADAFKYNLQAFSAAGYRAIAYDRKNVGRSSNTLRDAELGRPVGTTVQDLEELTAYLGLDRFHLVGVAAGAQVALQYAAKNPHKVSSMVLAATLGPQGLAQQEPEMAALQAHIALPFEQLCPMTIANPPPAPLRLISGTSAATVDLPAVTIEHRELGTWFRATDRDGVSEFLAIGDNARHRTFDGCRLINIGANQPGMASTDPLNPNTFAKLGSLITMRTLLLAGTGDVYYSPPAHMQLWGSYIPDAAYVQLDTGHAPQFENPEAFNTTVIRFLKHGPHGASRIVRPSKHKRH